MDCTVCLYGETTTTLLSWLQLSVITCASSSAMSHVFICLGEDAKGEKNSSRDDLGV